MTTFASDGTPVKSTPKTEGAADEQPDPEVVEPEVVDAEVTTDVAVREPEQVDDGEAPNEQLDPDWKRDRLEFKGDLLAIRKPPRQALAALHHAQYGPEHIAAKLYGKLLNQILGPESYERAMDRMMDFDDPEYTVETLGELVKTVSEIAAEGWKSGP